MSFASGPLAVLRLGLKSYFDETYAGDEVVCDWKDMRRIDVCCLIDDSVWHREHAARVGLAGDGYVVVPAFRSEADNKDPMGWVRIVKEALQEIGKEPSR